MKLDDLKNKEILILGLGKEGMDSFEFLRKVFPDKILGLADQLELKKFPKKTRKKIEKDKKIKLYLGKNYLKALFKYDVICRAPGVPWKKISPYLRKRQKVTSQTEIFFNNCPGTIIGITGTKGKGTTVSLLYKILKQGGLKVFLVGNIGKPVLSFLKSAKKDSLFVYELSSHQLQNLKKSPHVAVFLNLFPAHLDHFKNFREYKKAKENITLFQKEKDWFVYNKDEDFLKRLAKKSKAQKISFGLNSQALDCYLKNGRIFYRGEEILRTRQVPLLGKFNLYNVMAAIVGAKLFKVPTKTIKKGILSFRPLAHRLEFVGRFKGIEFYNDSLATVPEATICAIDTFKEKLQTIILGGHEAKQNFKELAKKILETKIENLIFFPPTGKRIWKDILKRKKNTKTKNLKPYFVENMRDAVLIAFSQTKRGKVCLLSCACPSFGVFKNYKERGGLFKKFVKLYGKKNT